MSAPLRLLSASLLVGLLAACDPAPPIPDAVLAQWVGQHMLEHLEAEE